jgi:uncharacterized protein (DUF1778 family)
MSISILLSSVALAVAAAAVWLVHKGLPAYFGAYLTEKGKNLATHEDLRLVLEQLRQTTRTTEQIRAVIGEDLWVRQEQWKLRRDTYLKAVSTVGELFNLSLRIHQVEQGLRSGTPEERATLLQELSSEQKRLLAEFRGARAAAAVVLADEATVAMDRYQSESLSRALDDPEFHARGLESLNRTYTELIALARRELRMPTAAALNVATGEEASTPPALPPQREL